MGFRPAQSFRSSSMTFLRYVFASQGLAISLSEYPLAGTLNVLEKWSMSVLTDGAPDGSEEPAPNSKTVFFGFSPFAKSSKRIGMIPPIFPTMNDREALRRVGTSNLQVWVPKYT